MGWTPYPSYYIAYGFILLALIEEASEREDSMALWLFQLERAHYKKELKEKYR